MSAPYFGRPAWQKSATAPPQYPLVSGNGSPVSLVYSGSIVIPPGFVHLHPGSGGEREVVRWTAPAAGSYVIEGRFQGLSTLNPTTDVAIHEGATGLFTGAIATYAWRLPDEARLPRLALAFILGGAIGNLIDRVRFGYVVDFIHVYWNQHSWPDFNVADSAISTGVALLLLDMLRPARRSETEPRRRCRTNEICKNSSKRRKRNAKESPETCTTSSVSN